MKHKTSMHHTLVLLLVFFAFGLHACGSPEPEGLTLQDLPLYPNATEGESMQADLFGMMGGGLTQYSTTDSYEAVLAFYNEALTQHHPEHMAHTSELGRQAVLSIQKPNGVISVAIQEFKKENQTIITFMEVGS